MNNQKRIYNTCAGCGRKTRSQLHQLFVIYLCRHCTFNNPDYRCLGVTRIKKEFRLTEEDLKTIPCQVKKNFHFGVASPQRIYREDQIVHLAFRRRIITESSIRTTEELISEASDEEIEKIMSAITIRRFQSKFRQNLFTVYNGTCVISNCREKSSLEAAHIDLYSRSGINDSTNGILLRADLHILFDRKLLLIHPEYLTVHLCPSVIERQYLKYNGVRIKARKDGKSPNRDLLKYRWNSTPWLNKSEKF